MTDLYLQDPDEEFEEDTEPDDPASEDIENGVVCANCEAEFEKEQGTPSLCPPCWAIAAPAYKEEYHQADCGTIR